MTVLAPPRAHPTLASGGWELFTVCTARGYLGVRREPDEVVAVVLGDLSHQGRPPASGTSSVRLEPHGRATVSCLSAPPALLAARSGQRLVPDLPSCREALSLEPGDMLVLCTADVLEHLDHGLPHLTEVTASIPDPSHRARAVAADIEALTPEGAAVIAVWVPSGPQPVVTDHHPQHRTEEARP